MQHVRNKSDVLIDLGDKTLSKKSIWKASQVKFKIY